MSGISPFTFVIWAPFHDLDDDGGVYYVPQEKSLETIKIEHQQGLVNGPTILNKMNTLNGPDLIKHISIMRHLIHFHVKGSFIK